jgi:hypothetical protein
MMSKFLLDAWLPGGGYCDCGFWCTMVLVYANAFDVGPNILLSLYMIYGHIFAL